MRLITRMDFDGLACGAMLMELGVIDSWLLAQPKEIQDGLIEVTENDVLCNLPYAEGCGLWFDHHSSEIKRLGEDTFYNGASYPAPSAARVVYEYYNGRDCIPHMEEMLLAVDKVDSGQLTIEEIINPKGWVLLGFIMDPRTGLERSHDRIHTYTVDDNGLMEELMDACRDFDIDGLLMLPNVAERVEVYSQQTDLFRKMLVKHSRIDGEIVITDLRNEEHIRTGNRFLLYSLYPQQNISMWIEHVKETQQCLIAVGYSVINRTAKVDVGHLLLEYGGGGHSKVGSCRVNYNETDEIIKELIEKIHACNA
jgi:hypothetical protein